MVVMPILYVVGIKMRRVMFPISWITQARLAEVATIVDENVNGVRVVKSFAQEEAEINRLADAAEGVAWAYIKDANIRAVWSPWVQNLPQLGLALVLLCGGWMVLHGRPPVSRDPRVQPLPLDAPGPLHDARPARDDGPARQGKRRAHLRDPRREPRDRRSSRRATTSLTCRARSTSTTSRSPTTTAQRSCSDFDAHIEPGETVALVGRTGSGKSTIARLMTRFYDVTRARSTIDGHDIRDVTLTSLRENVGVVLDEPFLFSISIRDNIAYGRPDASLEEIEAAARAANARRVHRATPRGLRHGHRRTRLHPVGRSAPAHRYRAHAAPQPPDPDPR